MSNYYQAKESGYKKYSQDLREDKIGKIIIMCGQEEFLIHWAVSQLVNKYISKSALMLDFITLDESCTLDDIIENCETLSMFSERRVVWVKNFPPLLAAKKNKVTGAENTVEGKSKVMEYLENYDGQTVIVFSYAELEAKDAKLSKIKKAFSLYEFEKLDTRQLQSFIGKRIKAAGLEISIENLKLIIDVSGYYNKESQYRLYNMVNDIGKLIAHCDGISIKEDDIRKVMDGDLDTYVFDFIEALSGNNKEKAFELLNNQLKGGANVFQLLSLIAGQFELMLEVKELKDLGFTFADILKELKIHEFRLKRADKLSEKFSKDKLKSLLVYLYEADRNIKSGNVDQRTSLEVFIGRV